MAERQGVITFQGAPLTLLGEEIKAGDKAPDFTLLDNDLAPKTLADYSNKVLIVSCVPSLDTPVCDIETQRFNNEAAGLADNIAILTVSMDLPFAQKRWCGAGGIDKVQTLSDHKDASLGLGYGILIKELRLLARCIFVIDTKGTVTYVQLVKEVTDEPDYKAVLDAAKQAS